MNSINGIDPLLLDAAVALMGHAGRLGIVRVLGESMRPILPPESLLSVDFAPADLRRGDLLLFRQGQYLAVHRLLFRSTDREGRPCLRTRGDNVLALDPPVDPARVIGRVTAMRRDGEWRDLMTPRARLYAALLAFHDFFWTGLSAVADRTLDRAFRALHAPISLRRTVARLDGALLRAADRRFFRAIHAPVPPPPGFSADPS